MFLHLLICKMEILMLASSGLFLEMKMTMMIKVPREYPLGEKTPGEYAEGGLGEG